MVPTPYRTNILLVVSFAGCGGSASTLSTAGDSGTIADAIPDVFGAQNVTCVPDAGAVGLHGDNPSIRDVVTGTNGSFIDTCDGQGNLVDYSCETHTTCGPGPNPGCTPFETGRVVPTSIDCSGHCVNGWCDGRCPADGDQFHFTGPASGGMVTIHDDTDGRTFVCTVVYDNPGDTFDCTTGPASGVTGTVSSLGLHGDYCTGKSFGNIGVAIAGIASPNGEACAYACSIP
jgi:hypothetical protein